jgi:anti-sigma B factor antagonist
VPRETQPSDPIAPPPSVNRENAHSSASSALPVLEATGELDLAVAPWLSDQLDALFVGGASSVIIDLSSATFLDSTALGVLVGALNRCNELGGRVHLVVTEPQILRVLSITGLSAEFVIHQNPAEIIGGGETS